MYHLTIKNSNHIKKIRFLSILCHCSAPHRRTTVPLNRLYLCSAIHPQNTWAHFRNAVFVLYTMTEPWFPPLKEGINGVKHWIEASVMKEKPELFRQGSDSPNQQNIKPPFFTWGCAIGNFTEGAANACGCLVGVWQPYSDVVVTSGNVEMPAYWESATSLKPPSSCRNPCSNHQCYLPLSPVITRTPL